MKSYSRTFLSILDITSKTLSKTNLDFIHYFFIMTTKFADYIQKIKFKLSPRLIQGLIGPENTDSNSIERVFFILSCDIFLKRKIPA